MLFAVTLAFGCVAAQSTQMAAPTGWRDIAVKETHEGRLLWLTLNRPKALNGWSTEMVLDLHRLFDWLMLVSSSTSLPV